MITVTSAVTTILEDDSFALEAISQGLLNYSAYAEKIKARVEEITFKSVRLGTIVVALTRVAKKIASHNPLSPVVEITSLSVTSSLTEVSFEITESNLTQLRSLHTSLSSKNGFFTATEGLHEITIVCSSSYLENILQHFVSRPKVILTDLVAVSVRFSDHYMDIPNTIYSLTSVLAVRHINLIEIVSTYTELTFIIHQSELEQSIQAFSRYSHKKDASRLKA